VTDLNGRTYAMKLKRKYDLHGLGLARVLDMTANVQATTTKNKLGLTTIENFSVSVNTIKVRRSWAWYYIPVIPTLQRLRQKDHEFMASLDYIVRMFLKKINKKVICRIRENTCKSDMQKLYPEYTKNF
jgi:hypothetical protein